MEEIDWGQWLCRREPVGNSSVRAAALLQNVHEGLSPRSDSEKCSVISGSCLYYHYGCDGQDDRGWGCGYRTVQTICSWLSPRSAPCLRDIQQALVTVGDKPESFVGSREWIGTYEAALVLDQLYNVPCRLVHARRGGTELERVAAGELQHHFCTRGSPVMMGGDRDHASRAILGVCTGAEGSCLLVMDPHYYGEDPDKEALQRDGWVTWRPVHSFDPNSFYNLCLPQTQT